MARHNPDSVQISRNNLRSDVDRKFEDSLIVKGSTSFSVKQRTHEFINKLEKRIGTLSQGVFVDNEDDFQTVAANGGINNLQFFRINPH